MTWANALLLAACIVLPGAVIEYAFDAGLTARIVALVLGAVLGFFVVRHREKQAEQHVAG